MANVCLPKEVKETFLKALKSGELDPAKLADMSSQERHAAFAKVVGEGDALNVNAEFESKLLLKNQQQGIINWAKAVGGLKPEVLKDLVTKVNKLDRVLNPAEEKAFLADLANKKLGAGVSLEEANKLSQLAKAADEAKTTGGRAYGHAILDFQEYVDSLKGVNKNIVSNIANVPKTIMSTLDLSAPLRQGWGMMSRLEFYKSFASIFKFAASKEGFRNLQADIISHPDYPIAKKAGLRISSLADKLSQREEQYMSTLVQKIPGVAASERGYVGFLNKLRFDTFTHLLESARINGEDVRSGSQATKDIANVVNDFTGSGNVGTGDKYASVVPALNATFFSPRKISATVNMFNPQRYLDPRISATARQAAIRQLVGSVAITTAILGLAKLAGGKIETDSNSSDFGKAVFGKTHFDFTGGNGNYAVLLSRLAQNKTKSTTTGKTTSLGIGYKPTTRADIALKFGRNKLSPTASLLVDWLYGSDSLGTPFNAKNEALQRVVPLIGQDIYQIQQNDPKNTFAAGMADLFGVGVQQY